MHHHHHGGTPVSDGARQIVLVGNPNVGKSVFFNALTGLYVDVSNYPGTTVEITRGSYDTNVVVDTPGIYGVGSLNDEERATRDLVLAADLVINVVDAVHLERDLFLTQQLIDMGLPLVVALNMTDEAKSRGLEINVDLLGDLLGVPVVPTVAVKRQGFDQLRQAIPQARPGHRDPQLESLLAQMADHVSRAEALIILEGDAELAQRHGLPPRDEREAIYLRRRARVNDIVQHVVMETYRGASLSTILGRLTLRPLTGIPIFLAVLLAMYYFIGDIVAQQVVGLTEDTVMVGMYRPAIYELVNRLVPGDSALGVILIGEFGLLTMTTTYLLGLLLPLVIGFYIALSVMEDSGYLPRLATLVDRLLTAIGLNGRAVVPLILGFGCVTMATITTRILGSSRERLIAISILGLAIPCSAQLGVIVGLLATLGPRYVAFYVAVIFSILVLVGTALNRVLPGQSTDLIIDLPPLRWPRPDNIARKTASKVHMFMRDAGPLFVLGSLLISLLQVTGGLEALQTALAPLTVGWLQLPQEAATAFVMGFVRRDFGAAGLTSMTLSPAQTLVAIITITLFVPCIASVMMLFKERSRQEAATLWAGCFFTAFLVGGVVSQVLI